MSLPECAPKCWKPSPILPASTEGNGGELLAVREIEPGKHLVVAYRGTEEDGFIITAFLTRRVKSLERRKLIWSPLNSNDT